MITSVEAMEGVRYASCSCCATSWNEVRVKCLACGSTKGIGYRAVESGVDEATIKAEVCDSCFSWTKILYQNKNPSLEAVADDVGSLGLDLLMKDTDYHRAGFYPYLAGY
jgi:FdhE protein